MNQSQSEKLKSLVQTSLLLNEQERKEWMGLLEVMNDKQALELEKILTSTPPKKEPSAPEALKKSNRIPHLSHIMNIPKDFSSAPNKDIQPKPQMPQKSQLVKSNELSSKLKDILGEKELPAGKPANELELPSGQVKPLPAIKPTPSDPVQTARKAPVGPLIKDMPIAPGPAIKPGILNAPKPTPIASKPAAAAPAPNPVSVPATPASPQLPKNVSAGTKSAKEITDLKGLTLKSWKELDGQSFLQNLKALVKKYGYHEVVFALEQSPIYSDYIDTGLKMLAEDNNFNHGKSLNPDRIMTKEEFEYFVDMLRLLQVG